jgi:hypothetical protein
MCTQSSISSIYMQEFSSSLTPGLASLKHGSELVSLTASAIAAHPKALAHTSLKGSAVVAQLVKPFSNGRANGCTTARQTRRLKISRCPAVEPAICPGAVETAAVHAGVAASCPVAVVPGALKLAQASPLVLEAQRAGEALSVAVLVVVLLFVISGSGSGAYVRERCITVTDECMRYQRHLLTLPLILSDTIAALCSVRHRAAIDTSITYNSLS